MKRGEFQPTNITYSTRKSLFILTQNRGSVPLAPNSGCPVFVTEEQRKAEMEKNMNKKYSPHQQNTQLCLSSAITINIVLLL